MQHFTNWGDAPFGPIPHSNCHSGIVIIIDTSTPEQRAIRYLWWEVIKKERNYVSLDKMAKACNLRYDQAETFVAKFHAERKVPRLLIVEEVEG